MNEEQEKVYPPQQPQQPHPHRIHLPLFISDEPIGLGNVIKQATSAVGIKPCGDCEARAGTLNRWLVFTGRRSK
jgi:hypothetical protein